VIATVCPPALQLSRITARGLSDHEARQRLAAQMPSDEKARRADYVIDTGGSFEETDAQVSEVWKKLI
jgi:dephospho-CoA kinase